MATLIKNIFVMKIFINHLILWSFLVRACFCITISNIWQPHISVFDLSQPYNTPINAKKYIEMFSRILVDKIKFFMSFFTTSPVRFHLDWLNRVALFFSKRSLILARFHFLLITPPIIFHVCTKSSEAGQYLLYMN